MLDTEQGLTPKHGFVSRTNEENIIVEEYQTIVEDLKRELHVCKAQQNNIRSELEVLRNENQNTNEVRESFNRIHLEECCNPELHKKEIENLQDRIALLRAEKESVQELWHISLNTIDILEEELKGFHGKGVKFYQEQANTVKETYSEAIKTLEGKLLQAKENFSKQQALCQSNKDKIEVLTKEKNDYLLQIGKLRNEAQDTDRSNQLTIDGLKKELSHSKTEITKIMQLKTELEKNLNEIKKFSENVAEKDKETKAKMAEALELIETAVREKDLANHREMLILEEKTRLEHRLAIIGNEYDTKVQEINFKTQEELERNSKRFLSDIKELKLELRKTTAQLNTVQLDLKLTEAELDRSRKDSGAKISEFEQKVKYMEIQQQNYDETKIRSKHDTEVKQLKEKITTLEKKLIVSNEKLQMLEQHASNNMQDQMKQAEKQSKDVLKKYANLESQLARTLVNKDDLIVQLKSLKHDFDQEIEKRDYERHFLENKIQELEINLQKENCMRESKSRNNYIQEIDVRAKNKPTLDITVENKCHCCQTVLSDQMSKLQEKFEKRTKELTHHVHVHQKLSKKWSDEAKSLTFRFQGKMKDLRSKMNTLQKENKNLTKELLASKQQLAQYTIEDIHRCNEANEIR